MKSLEASFLETPALRTSYRGLTIDIDDDADLPLAHIRSADRSLRYIVAGPTVFAAAESAFDLVDEVLGGDASALPA